MVVVFIVAFVSFCFVLFVVVWWVVFFVFFYFIFLCMFCGVYFFVCLLFFRIVYQIHPGIKWVLCINTKNSSLLICSALMGREREKCFI